MKIRFENTGDFTGLYAAQKWCDDNGYSYGSLCAPQPVGLLRGDFNIAKWKNLTAKERKQLHGIMTSDSFRNSAVEITIY